ncbi:MAG: hypothetical protein MMC23_010189 [Stictis urceolatum]|nr:hypothetical protein [Stictis urceolata]
MLGGAWKSARDWLDGQVHKTVVRTLTDSSNGKAVRKALPVVIALAVFLVVLLSQLVLIMAQTPQSFSAFLLAGPALATACMAVMGLMVVPASADSIPMYAVVVFTALAVGHSTVGAALNSFANVDWTLLAVVVAVIDAVVSYCVGKRLVRGAVSQMRRPKEQPYERQPESSDDDEKESEYQEPQE